ncbi:MAG: hypothetical protein WAO74_13035 [Polaribacter sp.]
MFTRVVLKFVVVILPEKSKVPLPAVRFVEYPFPSSKLPVPVAPF